jgi:uncharacterized protein
MKITIKQLAFLKKTTFLIVLAINIVAYIHAYKFTHFDKNSIEKTKNAKELTLIDKLKTICLGINNPRPKNTIKPNLPYETINLLSSKKIECWSIKIPNNKGIVVIFHGFSGNKSLMLDKSAEFNALGFSTFLVDFIGTGGSEGNETSIGYQDKKQ